MVTVMPRLVPISISCAMQLQQVSVKSVLFSFREMNFARPVYEGGSICNENPSITPSTNALGFYAICQTKDHSVDIIMVHETLFYLSKFYKFQTF